MAASRKQKRKLAWQGARSPRRHASPAQWLTVVLCAAGFLLGQVLFGQDIDLSALKAKAKAAAQPQELISEYEKAKRAMSGCIVPATEKEGKAPAEPKALPIAPQPFPIGTSPALEPAPPPPAIALQPTAVEAAKQLPLIEAKPLPIKPIAAPQSSKPTSEGQVAGAKASLSTEEHLAPIVPAWAMTRRPGHRPQPPADIAHATAPTNAASQTRLPEVMAWKPPASVPPPPLPAAPSGSQPPHAGLAVNLPPAPAPEAPRPAGQPIQTAGDQPPQPGLQPVRPLWFEFGSMQGQKPQPPRAVTNPWVKSADNTAPSEPPADVPASSRREKIQVGQAAPNNDPAAATVVKPLSAFPTEKSPASPVAADPSPPNEPVAKSPATAPATKSKAASTAAAPKKAKSAPKAESSAKSSPASAENKPATNSGSFPTQPPASVAKSPAMQAVSLSKSEPAAPAPAAVQPQPFAGYHAAPAEQADVPRFSGMTPALAALRSLAQAKNRRIEERRAAGAARLPAPHMPASIPQAAAMPPAAPEDFGKLPEGSPFEAIQESGTVKLRVNRSTLLRTKVNIERTASVDESIIEVVQYGARDVSIIGRKIGQTHVTFWFDDPAKPPVTYLVEVKPDTALTYQPQPKANTLATAAQASVQQQPPTPSVVPASSRRPAAAR